MDFYLATEEFKLHGTSFPGFPILVDREGRVVEEVQQYLIKHCIQRGRARSPRTWEKYGRDLYDFMSYCEANGIDWRDPGNDREYTVLARYRDWALSAEGGNGATTVNGRLRTVIKLYKDAHRRGVVSALPYDIEHVCVRRPQQFLAHVDATAGRKGSYDVMLRTARTIIRVLSTSQASDLVKAVGNTTHRLIIRLALTTGLRREELATFPLKYVVNPRTYTKHRTFIRVHCEPRDMKLKGDKPRGIDVPRGLMEDLWRYVITARHELELLVGRKQAPLFLNEDGLPFARHGDALLKIVKEAGRRAGLLFVNVHILRHTYATQTLFALRKRKSQVDPLMYVRDRLGHELLSTTQKYLHLLSEVEDDVSNAYQDEIDAITREAGTA